MHAEPRETKITHRTRIDLVGAVIEQVGIELDLMNALGGNLVDADRILVEDSFVKECELEGEALCTPDRAFRLESDVAVFVVAQLIELGG